MGDLVRSLRRERGLTLDALAEASGVSRAMISKVERGEKSPTVSVAAGIATGLGVTVGRLLGEERERLGWVLRRDRQLTFYDPESGFERRQVSGDGVVRVFRDVLPEGATTGEFPPEREGSVGCVTVESGCVEVCVGGEEYVLESGDSLTFRADVAHEFRNSGGGSARYYVVFSSSER